MADESFTEILITDVATAVARFKRQKDQSSMRDLVRTSFAAIEGSVWILREHVIDAANATYGLEPDEKAVLEEEAYQVTAQGKITRQTRFLPLLNSIRFLARIAQRIASKDAIDFSGSGWQKLQEAALIRNRVTHPKAASDLTLAVDDVETVIEAMHWFLSQIAQAMEILVSTRKDYLGEFEETLALLKAGDPATLALYNEANRRLADD